MISSVPRTNKTLSYTQSFNQKTNTQFMFIMISSCQKKKHISGQAFKRWLKTVSSANPRHQRFPLCKCHTHQPSHQTSKAFWWVKRHCPQTWQVFWSGVMKFPYILFWYVFFINESLRSSFRWNSFLWLHVSEIDILGAKSMKSGWLPLYEDEVILFD